MDIIDRHTARTQEILDAKFAEGKIKNLYIPEILEGLAEIRQFPERVKALKANSDRSLNTILLYTYGNKKLQMSSEDINSIVYREANGDDDFSVSPTTLFDVARRLYIFERTDIPKNKLRLIAFEILEGLHPKEAEVFKGIFAGKLPYKNITLKLVHEAFPDLFPEETKRLNELAEQEKQKQEKAAAKKEAAVEKKEVVEAPEEKKEETKEDK